MKTRLHKNPDEENNTTGEIPAGPVFLQQLPHHKTKLIGGFPKLTSQEAQDEVLSTPKEVADYMKVTVDTVYQWAMKGMIPAYRIDNTLRFKMNEIIAAARAYAAEYKKNDKKKQRTDNKTDDAREAPEEKENATCEKRNS